MGDLVLRQRCMVCAFVLRSRHVVNAIYSGAFSMIVELLTVRPVYCCGPHHCHSNLPGRAALRL